MKEYLKEFKEAKEKPEEGLMAAIGIKKEHEQQEHDECPHSLYASVHKQALANIENPIPVIDEVK